MSAKKNTVPPRDIHIVDVPEEFTDYVRPGETDAHMVVDEQGQGCLYFAKSPSNEHIDLVFLSQDTTDKLLYANLPVEENPPDLTTTSEEETTTTSEEEETSWSEEENPEDLTTPSEDEETTTTSSEAAG
jgi:hypothetical protein